MSCRLVPRALAALLLCVAAALLAERSAEAQSVATGALIVRIDDRLALEQRRAGLPLRHAELAPPGPGGLTIGPAEPGLRAIWSGQSRAGAFADWLRRAPAPTVPLNLILAASGGRISALALLVEESTPNLRPVIGRSLRIGCHPFRPGLRLENIGWGRVLDPVLTLRFGAGEAVRRELHLPLGSFDEILEVDLRDALAGLGADIAALAADVPGDCAAGDDPAACAAAFASRAGLGALAPLVMAAPVAFRDGRMAVLFHLAGAAELAFGWTDAGGQLQSERVEMALAVSLGLGWTDAAAGDTALARLLRPPSVGRAPVVPPSFSHSPPAAAPALMDIALADNRQRYRVPLRIAGNPRALRTDAVLSLTAPRSSEHRFRVVAELADGRVIRSLPVTLRYLRPRPQPAMAAPEGAGCSLPDLQDPPTAFGSFPASGPGPAVPGRDLRGLFRRMRGENGRRPGLQAKAVPGRCGRNSSGSERA